MYPMEILLITLPMGIIKKLCYTAHHLSNGERFLDYSSTQVASYSYLNRQF